ncbi:hypothetical protein [Pseudomonas sp. LRF_L74]|uniref:hypothetical protein n=1 Tax=Pseudomonas sp. LRF_L74 TaxID=3369422 RepID=UPI003F5FBB93
MSINPVDSSAVTDGSDASVNEQSFNDAIENAEGELSDADFEEQLITGAITVGGQMIIMPRANDILNEAMSDE